MKVAIVGGGIGGLVTALLLTKQGIEVEIFEKEEKLGGRLAFTTHEDYRIDEGPTIVLLPHMLQEILAEAGISSSQYELIKCDPLYTINYLDGTTYTKHGSLEKQLEEIKQVFPGEETNFSRFMTEMKANFALGNQAFLQKTFAKKRDFWTWNNLKVLSKLNAHQSVNKYVSSHFKDERLEQAYSLQSLYIGGNPYTSPAIYSLVPYSEHEHGIYYVKGGYASLVEVIEEELQKRRVTIHLNCKVEEICFEDSKATGLIANQNKYLADAVVLNGDFPLMANLAKQKEKKYTPSSSCLLLYFGLKKRYTHGNVHQFFMGDSFKEHMNQVFTTKELPNDPAVYTFYPSLLDETLAPEGKSVLYTLIPVPSGDHIDWENQNEFIEKMIDQIEKRAFPGLRQEIEWMKVRTPSDARNFGLYEGGSFGIAPELFQSGVFRPQYRPYEYENVFAVGASIHPGGGVPIVMQGAKLLANHLIEEKNKHVGKEQLTVDGAVS
ncbi:phytoene desaturase family protein [Metabacillus iocasae]|uniref:Phytoene desaturase n=1 Tax=Priestia iocasae TaxID=2291674 RepID=A0ABS2QT36_9BACI|nr:phytoene desaturase family protein [Metabacillus iocasae]MBM7702626.1 phytoene desaturase [Metabacillus iocasae]